MKIRKTLYALLNIHDTIIFFLKIFIHSRNEEDFSLQIST